MAVLITCLCIQGSAHSFDETVVEVPFTFEKGYVIVQAKILRQVPVELVLATGAEHSTFNAGVIDKYHLSLNYTFDHPQKYNPADCTYTYSNISNITLGDLKPFSLSMRIGVVENINKRVGRSVFGILGADFFKGRIAQFDFTRKVARFLSHAPGNASRDNKTPSGTERIVMPMGYYDEYTTLPIAEEVTFDGRKIKTVIDTGAATVVSLSPSATKELGQALPPDKSTPRPGSVSVLRLGNYEITDVPVLLYGKGAGFDQNSKGFGAIAGTGLLQNFVATFDFRGKVIILEHV